MGRPRAETDSSRPGVSSQVVSDPAKLKDCPRPPLEQQTESMSLEKNEPEGKGQWVMGTPGN